jgi:LmbE family N-acetylglucosaminyl deacetylase
MPRTLHLALALCLTLPAAAQQIDDPANLMGERVSPPALADTLPIDHGAPALEQLLRKLRTRASMMLIVAHPDDEDSGMLTYESRGMGARVAMLTLTRGEGGQNLMSADFNDALGLIRTQELLAEDRYTGTDQLFGTEVDFGFSKTKEESFAKWGHDRVLYDAVRAVRLYRPLVLASVFIGEPTDGHGQHQVSGEIAQEVFLAAADPKVFPEMGLPPWAPLKVYGRVPFARITEEGMFDYATGKYLPPRFENYVTGKVTSTPPAATVTIHEGDRPNIPAFNGMSYIQWARQGLALQKSQIGPNFRIPPAGAYDSGYTLYGSRVHCITTNPGAPCLDPETWASAKPTALSSSTQSTEEDLFTGIDTTLPSLGDQALTSPIKLRPALEAIDARIAEAQRSFDPAHVERVAPALREALEHLDSLLKILDECRFGNPTEKFNLLHELRIKHVQLNNALILALGITVDASLGGMDSNSSAACAKVLTSDKFLAATLKIGNQGELTVHWNNPSIELLGKESGGLIVADNTGVRPGTTDTAELEGDFAKLTPATRPYFKRPDVEQPFYDLADPALRNAPSTPDPITARVAIYFQGLRLVTESIVHYPGTNLSSQAVQIVPPVSIEIPTRAGILTPAFDAASVESRLDTQERQIEGDIALQGPPNWEVEENHFKAADDHDEMMQRLVASPAGWLPGSSTSLVKSTPAGSVYLFHATATENGKSFTEGYRAVGYPGLTTTNYYTPATYKATAVDVTAAPQLHIAYLPGTGDEVPQFLPSLGVTPTILTTKDLSLENLKQYDAILLGVRAYSAHPELEGAGSDVLNAYARQGGVVIVQYSSAGFNPSSAPYPYTVPGDSAHNVVDETVPVTLLQPANPLLTWPNHITPADFNGWIEERGHGFATDWSPEYTPLLEMHDPDQDPQKGGLLLAKIGRGAYIYCALALYRQLPEGVPGGYRLFANLLSYAKNPKRDD